MLCVGGALLVCVLGTVSGVAGRGQSWSSLQSGARAAASEPEPVDDNKEHDARLLMLVKVPTGPRSLAK